MEIQKRLNELSEKVRSLLLLSDTTIPRSTEEKIRLLERWLANIRERKRG